MQEKRGRGYDTDVFVGLHLVNKHNGCLAIVTDSRITDYGRISWLVQKHTESFNLTWTAADITEHWFLCTGDEYRQLLAFSEESYIRTPGIIPIKNMEHIEFSDTPDGDTLFSLKTLVGLATGLTTVFHLKVPDTYQAIIDEEFAPITPEYFQAEEE